jgi:two-component system, NarL family, nitrate/nitrite response regulator NarL
MMREVLRRACAAEFGHEVVGEASSGRQAVETVLRTAPDLLLLDLQLPEMSGLDALEQLRQHPCQFKTLILSSCCDDYTVFRVEQERVNGFVLKNTSTVSILGEALDAISRGRRYFSEAFQIKSSERRANPTAFDKLLTDRERLILIMLSRSPADRIVASQLNISAETVEKHRFNILRKLGLRSTAELVRFAHAHGFNQLEIEQAEN